MNMRKIVLMSVAILLNLSIVKAGKFEGSFAVHMEDGKSKVKKQAPEDINISVRGEEILMMPSSGAKGPKTKIIINLKEQTTLILMDNNGNKHAIRRPMNEANMRINSHDDTKMTETKETKVVDGYKCKKFIFESSVSRSEVWVTTDVEITAQQISAILTAGRGPQGDRMGLGSRMIPGCPILMVTTDKKTKEEHTISIKNIKKGPQEASMFSSEGYQISEIPNHPGPVPPGTKGRPNGNNMPAPGAPGAPNMPGAPNGPAVPPTMGPDGKPIPPGPNNRPMPPANMPQAPGQRIN